MTLIKGGTVDTQTFSGVKEFVLARSSALQNSNIGANDHLKLDTTDFQRGGSSGAAGVGVAVKLDGTTTYSNTSGAASLGRFSLAGGKLYKLTCSPGYFLFSGNTGVITLQWFDVTAAAGVAIGQPLNIFAATDASHENADGVLMAMFAPGGGQNDISLVEVQITAVTALTSIGNTSKGVPVALVETY